MVIFTKAHRRQESRFLQSFASDTAERVFNTRQDARQLFRTVDTSSTTRCIVRPVGETERAAYSSQHAAETEMTCSEVSKGLLEPLAASSMSVVIVSTCCMLHASMTPSHRAVTLLRREQISWGLAQRSYHRPASRRHL